MATTLSVLTKWMSTLVEVLIYKNFLSWFPNILSETSLYFDEFSIKLVYLQLFSQPGVQNYWSLRFYDFVVSVVGWVGQT